MDLLMKLLIVLPHLLMVTPISNFSLSSSDIKNLTDPNGAVDQDIVQQYTDFINSIESGDFEDAIIDFFSSAFKDCYCCYPPYPCFQIGGQFITREHPISLPPYPPWLMGASMDLYTRRNPTTPFSFSPNDVSKIDQSHFNSNSTIGTKFIIGGFLAGISGVILTKRLIPALLAHSDCNVFVFNWITGSAGTYGQAAANSRLGGAMVSRFVGLIVNATGYTLSNIHFIGHSLGAHLGGYAGYYLDGKVGRISGLDPAGPYFKNTEPIIRLDVTDAVFVDITHTNAGNLLQGALGIDQQIGDMDFYPNGGSKQPGCSSYSFNTLSQFQNLVEVVSHFVSCDHEQAVYLYTESIYNAINSSCQFQSYTCPNYATFQLGQCNNCGLNGTKCAEMGFNAYKYAEAGHQLPVQEKFYLSTNKLPPFCKK